MNTTEMQINKVKLEDDSILLSIELPRGNRGEGRSLEIVLSPKTQSNPIAGIGLNFEWEGEVFSLCGGAVGEKISNEIYEALEG